MIPNNLKIQLQAAIDTSIATNNTGDITAAILNTVLTAIVNAVERSVVDTDNAPTVESRFRVWRDGNLIKMADESRQGSPFSAIITKLSAVGVEDLITLDPDTGTLTFNLNKLVLGPYDDDAAAINDGVASGRLYSVSANNPYSIDAGFVRVLLYDEQAVAYNDGVEANSIYNDGVEPDAAYNA